MHTENNITTKKKNTDRMALQLYYKVENVTRQKKQDQDLLNLNVPFPRTNKYVTPTISHVATVA